MLNSIFQHRTVDLERRAMERQQQLEADKKVRPIV